MTSTTPPSADAVLEASQWDLFWLPDDARVVDRPEILYTCTPRNVVGLNVVSRTRARDRQRLQALAAEVSDAHRGVHSRWMVVPANHSDDLEAVLADAGYVPGPRHIVYTMAPERYVPRQSAASLRVARVDSIETLRDWIDVFESAFERALPRDEAHLASELEACTRPDARTYRFVVYDGDRPITAAGLGVFPALSLGFFWAGGTIADARGRGAYSAAVAARIACARELGLSLVGLYAREDTSAPIVARQGFERHGWMIYWERAADQAVTSVSGS